MIMDKKLVKMSVGLDEETIIAITKLKEQGVNISFVVREFLKTQAIKVVANQGISNEKDNV